MGEKRDRNEEEKKIGGGRGQTYQWGMRKEEETTISAIPRQPSHVMPPLDTVCSFNRWLCISHLYSRRMYSLQAYRLKYAFAIKPYRNLVFLSHFYTLCLYFCLCLFLRTYLSFTVVYTFQRRKTTHKASNKMQQWTKWAMYTHARLHRFVHANVKWIWSNQNRHKLIRKIHVYIRKVYYHVSVFRSYRNT